MIKLISFYGLCSVEVVRHYQMMRTVRKLIFSRRRAKLNNLPLLLVCKKTSSAYWNSKHYVKDMN